MPRIANYLILVSIGVALGGCAAGNNTSDGSAKLTADAPIPTELAAYAARHQYPQTQAGDDLRVAALISPDRTSIRLYNFSNQPLADVDVWVNRAWLQHVRGIGANGSVTLKTVDLYNAFGKNFASQAEPVSKVQLDVGGHFYNAMGPVTE